MEVLCLVGSGSGDAYALWGNESGNSNALLGIASGESLSALFPRGPFVLSFVLFFFLISFIKIIFELFVSSRAASLLSLLPASLLVLLLHRTVSLPFLAPAIIAAAILRLLSGLLIRPDLPSRQNLLSQQDLPSRQDLQFRRSPDSLRSAADPGRTRETGFSDALFCPAGSYTASSSYEN